MRLAAQVPAERLGELQIGTPVDFTIAGLPGRLRGIERINPVVDPTTRQVEIHVSLPNDAGRLVGGLYAEGRVAAAGARCWPCRRRRSTATGEAGVLRVAGGHVERVPVELGITDEESERVEVARRRAGDLLLIGAARGITPRRQGARESAAGARGRERARRRREADPMFISDFAIKRPIVTVVTMLALVVFGIFALWALKVDEFPDVRSR